MTINELKRRSKRLRQRDMEADFFRFLKRHKQKELLEMQNIQLFRNSEGKDGVPLGRYSIDNYQKGTGLLRAKGSPFWMEDSGQLKDKMRVKVFIARREISFENKRADVDKPWFRFNEDVFATSEWFGLNEENMQILQDWGRRFAKIWVNNMMAYGKRTTNTNLI